MDKTESRETWNKKKIVITLIIVFGLLGFLFKTFVLSKNKDLFNMKLMSTNFLKSVKGISTQEAGKTKDISSKSKSAFLPIQAVIKEKLDDLKKEVNSLNVVNIASSSPQIQKIINDLNSLREYPVNETKEICQRV
ncbi:hypothetical protein HY041_00185, partial [Candidatus Roizmanbacteria bacterium]|nr:hypothetical protein [Candidatus Roizmanbacteria bacterium]